MYPPHSVSILFKRVFEVSDLTGAVPESARAVGVPAFPHVTRAISRNPAILKLVRGLFTITSFLHLIIGHQAIPDKNEPPGIIHHHLIMRGKDEGDILLSIHLPHHLHKLLTGL